MRHIQKEHHLVQRLGWLRAAVLGANDGLISTACLVLGVASASSAPHEILLAGIAGLVAGAMSMAAGEFVSVSSQADSEAADLGREKRELEASPETETLELAQIYVERGLDPGLARQVAEQLMAKDALGAHARDELGISPSSQARPIQAALASAAAFAAGAVAPLVLVLISPEQWVIPLVAVATLLALAVLGAAGAKAGGAKIVKPTLRVTFWGAIAMAITMGIGTLVGKVL